MSQLTSLSALFCSDVGRKALAGIRHGVERESLRIQPNGHLSTQSHPQSLGSALCHDAITTDYAEVLMEFITQPHDSIDKVMDELHGVHQFVLQNLPKDEMLWPFSMPCYVSDENKVELAQYGSSNIGKMKTLYREGLRNRYGTMMQLIAGVHFNFSLSDEFWQHWYQQADTEFSLQDFRSEKYMGLIRNFKRYVWLIPYLYGASPSLCSSFLQGRETGLDFKKLGKGTIYLPYATSLRMSDLGYTNNEQSALNICYNDLPSYIKGLRRAIKTPSKSFADIGVKVDGQYRQLNDNILQIENEFYSPIRPKQVAESGELPTLALERRGISYVEVRALDINPFEVTGLSRNSFYFIDSFLLFCLFSDSPELTVEQQHEADENLNRVVLNGRDPQLKLLDGGSERGFRDWAEKLFSGIQQTAALLDEAYGTEEYTAGVAQEAEKIANPRLTPSAKLLDILLEEQQDNGEFAIQLAKKYQQQLQQEVLDESLEAQLKSAVTSSIDAQIAIESSDIKSFEQFLADYFAQ